MSENNGGPVATHGACGDYEAACAVLTGAPKSGELRYAREVLTPVLISEMIPLQDRYWQEVAGPFHNFPPDVDWLMYLGLEAKGALRVVCGRDAAGSLAAGAIVPITPHPHYACILASLPLLFVHPDYRRGREGMRLVKKAEEEAEKAGAQLMMTHGGVHNGVYRLFEFLRYSDFGRYFVKVLRNGPNGTTPIYKEAR